MVLVRFGPLMEALDPVLQILVMFGVVVLLIEAAVLLGNVIGPGGNFRNGS
jgi:hypothetical protein